MRTTTLTQVKVMPVTFSRGVGPGKKSPKRAFPFLPILLVYPLWLPACPMGAERAMLHVKQGVATVQDVGGRTYRTPSLMGEDVDAMLLAEEERAAQEYEEARRALYRARAQRRSPA